MSDVSQFEKYWNKFTTQFRGTLLSESKNQSITYSTASILLSDAAMCWGLSYDECGRWLCNYIRSNPEKGELVLHILTKDMQFTELPPKKGLSSAAKVIVPVAGAVVGGGIAHFLGANLLVQAISAVVPAALLVPATASIASMIADNNKSVVIEEYMAQLEKYKQGVITVLSDY